VTLLCVYFDKENHQSKNTTQPARRAPMILNRLIHAALCKSGDCIVAFCGDPTIALVCGLSLPWCVG